MQDKAQEVDKQCEHMPKRPIGITVASIVWIVLGSLNLLGTMFFLIVFVLTSSNKIDFSSNLFVSFLIALPIIFFGVVFIYIGEQTIKGKARDVVGNSIGSILIGVFFLLIGAFFLFVDIQRDSVTNIRAYITTLFLAAIFVVAGILALAGRNGYKAWRNTRIKQVEDSK